MQSDKDHMPSSQNLHSACKTALNGSLPERSRTVRDRLTVDAKATGSRAAALALFFLILTALTCVARSDRINFVKATDLSRIGLQVRMMAGASENPMPPATSYVYEDAGGARLELYDPHELWVIQQHIGRWTDSSGHALVLALPLLSMPTGFNMQHASRAEYRSHINKAAPVKWDDKELSKWVTSFTRLGPVQIERLRSPFRLGNLLEFTFKANRSILAYAFTLKRNARGTPANKWYFALFELNSESDIEGERATIMKKFFATIRPIKITDLRADRKDGRFQSKEFNTTGGRSTKFQESRRQVLQSIANLKNWWHVETDNYIIASDLGSRHRVLALRLQSDIEYLRSAYSQLIPARKAIDEVSVIRVFATPKEYVSYVPAAQKWSAGLWMPNRRELVIKPIDWGGNKEMRRTVLSHAYHEAFHQYIFYAYDKTISSRWFDEGHAVMFGNAEVRNKSLVVKESQQHVRLLEKMIAAEKIDIKSMLKMTSAAFYLNNDTKGERRAMNYALAWGIIYYLRKGISADQDSPYQDILQKYADALWEHREEAKATAVAFNGIDIEKFKQDFVAFWGSKRERSAAKRNRIFEAS